MENIFLNDFDSFEPFMLAQIFRLFERSKKNK